MSDEGLQSFKGVNGQIEHLAVNGLRGITALGLTEIITANQKSLVVLEASLMDQEQMNGQFLQAVSLCFNLEQLDLTGDINIDDMGIAHLSKGEQKNEQNQVVSIGL